jgi:acetoin utilization protein AcuB
MIARDWMRVDPVTVTSDTLVAEARRLLTEGRQRSLPVVDGGRLRGLVTSAHCLRAGHFVTRTQDPDELDYFVTRLKVKDIMVRNPATVEHTDTVEHCISKGRALRVSQFPVMQEGRVVGLISAHEIYTLTAHLLGAWAGRGALTIGPLEPRALGRVVQLAEDAGAVLQALHPIGRGDEEEGAEQRVIIRFHAEDPGTVAAALAAAGIPVGPGATGHVH